MTDPQKTVAETVALKDRVMTLEYQGGLWVTAEDYKVLAARLAEVEASERKWMRYTLLTPYEAVGKLVAAEARIAELEARQATVQEAAGVLLAAWPDEIPDCAFDAAHEAHNDGDAGNANDCAEAFLRALQETPK